MENIFEQFKNVGVLIVGDVMLDRYLTGKISRISPEAPVPVVDLEKEENRLGGAANVALNIQSLGATPFICSVVGEDENGELFKELLLESGIVTGGIVSSVYRQTTVKTRVLASGQQVLRVDREDRYDLIQEETNRLLREIDTILEHEIIHVILFQDYNKGVLTKSIISTVIGKAKARGIPTVVDPKKRNFFAYRGVTLFKPNLKEIAEGLNEEIAVSTDDLDRVGVLLREKLNNRYNLITLSDKGIYYSDDEHGEILETRPRSIADVCGAGDTVVSIAALGLAISLDIKDIARLANIGGGLVCEKVGVVPVDSIMLQEEYYNF